MHTININGLLLKKFVAQNDYGGPLDNPTYVTMPSESSQYRTLDNSLYDTHIRDESSSLVPTYENVGSSQDPTTGARRAVPSQYSVISRRDSDVSSSHTYSDVDEKEDQEAQEQSAPIESQYSVIKRDGNNTARPPIESQYSVVTRDNDEVQIESGYSVITQSNLGHDVEEASDSDTDGEEEDSRKKLLKPVQSDQQPGPR